MNSCLVVAGEKSGEEHAMSFFPDLKKMTPNTIFYGVGGDLLSSEGLELNYHLKDFSSMGFSEVISKLPFYFRALNNLEKEIVKRGTRTAILIDFQDFNMRLAARLKRRGVNVLYYVAPQAWAWKSGRVQALSKNVHTLFTILPFEKEWFCRRGVKQVFSVPHPLMLTYKNELQQITKKPFGCWREKLKILILPGSRKFEVHSLLPEFIKVIKILRQTIKVEAHIVRVEHLDPLIYDYYSSELDVFYSSHDLTKAMKECHFALAASGTVTLSTALFELPTIVCYKSSLLNEFIFNNFIKYRGPISLTNIVHDKYLFPEFTQASVEARRLCDIIHDWMSNKNEYNFIKMKLTETKELLSGEKSSVPFYMSRVIDE